MQYLKGREKGEALARVGEKGETHHLHDEIRQRANKIHRGSAVQAIATVTNITACEFAFAARLQRKQGERMVLRELHKRGQHLGWEMR